MNSKSKFLFTVMLLFTLILAACANDDNTSENNGNDDEVKKESSSENSGELNIALSADPNSLDPHAANDGNSLYVMSTMYDKLVYLDEELNITPGLAESLEPISDTVWEAKLREGVTFHDGSDFNAEVVKANLDRILDPEMGAPVLFLFNMIKEVTVQDDYTVHIETEFPFSALPAHLAHPAGHMISKEAIDKDYEAVKNGDLPFTSVNEQPVGTGPFIFEERDYGESIVVVRNEDYWGDKAKSEKIEFRTIPEDQTRIVELETGGADLIYPVAATDVATVDATDNIHVKQSDSSNLTYLGFNTEVEPFNNPDVRRAISMAIDKDKMIDGLLDGIAVPAKGPLAPTVKGYSEDVTPLPYDIEEAKKLLADAGYADGFKTTILTNELQTLRDLAIYIQAELAPLGIEVEVESAESGAYLDITGQGKTEMFIGTWGTVTLDADYGLYAMFHSSNKGGPGNRSFFDNEELDQLLDNARQETDDKKRTELYVEAQDLLAQEAPVAYLYHSVLLAGLNDNVEGFWQYPSSILYLKDTYVKK